MKNLNSEKNIIKPKKRICDVAEFVEHVVEWKFDGMMPTAFRGQRHYSWKTKAKIFRPDIGLFSSEDLAVRDIVSIHPSEFTSDKTMFDRLVRMQHFGLPTRLLDVTSNPLVALWFATETSSNPNERHGSVQAMLIPKSRQRYYDSDRVSCMANLANLKKSQKEALFKNARKNISIPEFNKTAEADMLVFHIGMEKPNFRPLINPSDLLRPVYVKPKMSNKRIIAQSGAFLLYGTDINRSNGEELTKSTRVWIHEDDKPNIRLQLEMLGIHESFLFPEIDKSSKFITDYYSPNGRGRNVDVLL